MKTYFEINNYEFNIFLFDMKNWLILTACRHV